MATQPSDRDETLAALLAAPPPRPVPPELRRAAARQAASGRSFVLGALVFAAGMLLCAATLSRSFWNDLRLDRSAVRTDDASIVSVTRTFVYEGRYADRRRPLYRYDFVYRPTGASAELEGLSFVKGHPRHREDRISVEYLAADPTVARLTGTRLNAQGYGAFLGAALPLAGLLLAAYACLVRRQAVRLLALGTLAEATVTECTRFMSGGKRRRMAFRIRLAPRNDAGGVPWTLTTTRSAIGDLATQRMADQQPVFVLFDPARPKRLLLPETLI